MKASYPVKHEHWLNIRDTVGGSCHVTHTHVVDASGVHWHEVSNITYGFTELQPDPEAAK